jgi:ribonuclease D
VLRYVSEWLFRFCLHSGKDHAELDSRENKDVRSTAGVPRDTAHPDLYRQLLPWRDAMAEDFDIALHEVLSTRSLQELVWLLPTDRASLKTISGIGKGKLKRFGEDLLEIIRKYCSEKNIVAKAPQPSKVNTKRVSFDLYKAGKPSGRLPRNATWRSVRPKDTLLISSRARNWIFPSF